MLRCEASNEVVSVFLCGEIDHHKAPEIRQEIDRNILCYRPKLLILDFTDVSFMDSSGIGLIMGRYKNMASTGGRVEIICHSERIIKLLKMAGIDRIAQIRKENKNEDS